MGHLTLILELKGEGNDNNNNKIPEFPNLCPGL